jgi:hypothetical protein
MEYADIINRAVLVALGVGFGLGGLVAKLLEPVRGPRPRRREVARPRPGRLPRGGHPLQGTSANRERRPGEGGTEIGPDRLRQLLERGPVTGRYPPVPLAPAEPGRAVALAQEPDAAPR